MNLNSPHKHIHRHCQRSLSGGGCAAVGDEELADKISEAVTNFMVVKIIRISSDDGLFQASIM